MCTSGSQPNLILLGVSINTSTVTNVGRCTSAPAGPTGHSSFFVIDYVIVS